THGHYPIAAATHSRRRRRAADESRPRARARRSSQHAQEARAPPQGHGGTRVLRVRGALPEGRPARWPDQGRCAGASGGQRARQLVNRTQETVRFLAFSNQQPDIIVRPDSGTIGLAERRPQGGGLAYDFRIAEAIVYIEGERAP